MTHIRITTVKRTLEAEIKRGDNQPLKQWLSESIKELEYKARYSGKEETQILQAALRALDDIVDILED